MYIARLFIFNFNNIYKKPATKVTGLMKWLMFHLFKCCRYLSLLSYFCLHCTVTFHKQYTSRKHDQWKQWIENTALATKD